MTGALSACQGSKPHGRNLARGFRQRDRAGSVAAVFELFAQGSNPSIAVPAGWASVWDRQGPGGNAWRSVSAASEGGIKAVSSWCACPA